MRTKTNRRQFLSAAASVLAAPGILSHTRAYAADPVVRVGHISPATGPLAGFAEADPFVLEGVRAAFAEGVNNNGKRHTIEIITMDSESNPARAAQAANVLIQQHKVDLLVAASTPQTVSPVANIAEANGVPCITTTAPWQSYLAGRGNGPNTSVADRHDFTYHFFWGLEDITATFIDLWDSADVGKTIGLLYPDDVTGRLWADPAQGFPKSLTDAGYTVINPGLYSERKEDFSDMVETFRKANCQIITGNMSSSDFATFWSQCVWGGFKPNVVTVAKALLFPSVMRMLGRRGYGLTSEIWWSPNHPFTSSLTGESARQLADNYQRQSQRSWLQPLGFKHALFEIVKDVVARSEDLDDANANAAAVRETSLSTVVGDIDWGSSSIPNISKTPLVSGQWQPVGNELDLVITSNRQAPQIPVGGELLMIYG